MHKRARARWGEAEAEGEGEEQAPSWARCLTWSLMWAQTL